MLANRGYTQCREKWEPTINYLTEEAAPYKFELVPLSFDELLPAVQSKRVDFIICNSSIFIDLEAIYNATAIATLNAR